MVMQHQEPGANGIDRAAAGDPPGECPRGQRRSALGAFAAAAILLVLAWAAARGAGTGGGIGGGSGTGIGTGTGSGLGPGTGTGTGRAGDGPGSGADGSGRGSEGPDAPIAPKGDPSGTVIADAATEARTEAPAPGIAPAPEQAVPEFGFTRPDAPPPPPPPPARTVGVPDGGPSRGAEGVAGGGGGATGQQIVDVVQAYPNSRLVVNLDATSSMASSRDAVARVFPEILDKMQGGTIAVHVFRDILLDEENEVVIKSTPRTQNKKSVASMIEKVKSVELRGGGDMPETGYQLVIANMRKYSPGTKDRPNVEFIITDAPEKQPELLDDLLKLAERTNTLVFVIDVSQSPPKRTQLK